MTPNIAQEYISRRMKDLGISEYYLQLKHFALDPSEIKIIDAYNQFFVLTHELDQVSITSDFGLYDLSDPNINEHSYEHQGTITITNNSQSRAFVRFIQIIPKN